MTLFSITVTFCGTEVRTSTYELWGDTVQPITPPDMPSASVFSTPEKAVLDSSSPNSLW